jgi:hypothetical protein
LPSAMPLASGLLVASTIPVLTSHIARIAHRSDSVKANNLAYFSYENALKASPFSGFCLSQYEEKFDQSPLFRRNFLKIDQRNRSTNSAFFRA